MKIQFKVPFRESLAFQQAYQRDFRKQVTPKWFRIVSSLALFVAVIGFGHWLFPDTGPLVGFYFGTLLIAWLWSLAHARIYAYFLDRYLNDSVLAEVHTAEVASGLITFEHQRIIRSFPLAIVSMAYEREGFLYVYFGRLGAARIPWSAFDSVSQRQEFLNLVLSEKVHPIKSVEAIPGAPSASAPQH